MDRGLYEAASTGDLDYIAGSRPGYLIDLDQLTPLHNTILHIAVNFRQKDFAARVIELCPYFLEQVDADGNTPLHVAAKIGCTEISQLLVDRGQQYFSDLRKKLADPNSPSLLTRVENRVGDTALHVSVRNGHLDVVDLLIREDGELSTCANHAGETPVFLAVEGGFFDIARHILRASSPTSLPSISGPHGTNALLAALIRTHHGRELEYYVPDLSLENIRRIIRDSLLNLQGRLGGFRTQQIDIIRELVEKWPEMAREADGHKWTPLHYAAHLGHLEATRFLLQVDTSVTYFQNAEGMSPFHLAARAGHVKVMEELINYCPDVFELLDNKGRTALHFAVANAKAEAVRFVLKSKKLEGLVNLPDENGNTPLHLAAYHGKYNILMALTYDQRVNKKLMNKNHLKAIDIIQSNAGIGELKKTRIMKKMEQAGGRQSLRRIVSEARYMQKDGNWEAEQEAEGVEELLLYNRRGLTPDLLYSSSSSSRSSDDIIIKGTKSIGDNRSMNMRHSRLKEIMGTHLLVAALIATVTYTAGSTVPGGYEAQGDSPGTAFLASKVAFELFLIANGIAFYCSTASAFLHFLASLEQNYYLLRRFTRFAAALTYISILSLVIAFSSDMHAILAPKHPGFSNAFLVLGCFFLGFCLFGFI